MKAKDIMVTDVVTLRLDDTLKEAAQKFAENNIGGCPVVDDSNYVVGVLSEADILASLKTQYKQLKMKFPPASIVGISFVQTVRDKETMKAFEEIGNTKVRDVMSRDVVTASAEESLESTIRKMAAKDVNRIPVVIDGKLVGIVTRGDVIKNIARTITQQETP